MSKFLNSINEAEESKNESFQKEKFVAIKKDYTKLYISAAVAVVAIIASFFFLNQKVDVTNMVGWSLSDANNWASSNTVQLVVHEIYDEAEANTVISQNVLEGESVAQKSSIEVEVSLGFDPKAIITLPNFDESWTKTQVLTWLEENGIENFTFVNVEDETKLSGTVLSVTTPESISDYLREQAIEFTVTILPAEVEIVVLDFLNYTVAQIDAWASENEISVRYIEGYSDTTASGKVLSQSIVSGEIMNPDEALTITLSKGPAIKIIDFTNVNATQASTWAKDNLIDLTIVNEYSSQTAKDVAIYQSIGKDQIVEQGTDLTMFYSLGNEITVASYVGQAITTLQSFVDTQNQMKAYLSINVSYSYSASVAVNKIISQSVRDAKVGIGSTIDVIVSLGNLVTVPDFTSLSTSSAIGTYNAVTAQCTTSKLTCQILFTDDDSQIGAVLSQSQVAGVNIADTTVVEIRIAD